MDKTTIGKALVAGGLLTVIGAGAYGMAASREWGREFYGNPIAA